MRNPARFVLLLLLLLLCPRPVSAAPTIDLLFSNITKVCCNGPFNYDAGSCCLNSAVFCLHCNCWEEFTSCHTHKCGCGPPPNFTGTFTNFAACPTHFRLCFNPGCEAGIVTVGGGCEFFKDVSACPTGPGNCGSFLSFDVRAVSLCGFHCGFLPVCCRGGWCSTCGFNFPGDYFVGRCCCGNLSRDFFIFCTSSLAGRGTVCSASLVAAEGGFCGSCCQTLVLHKVCVSRCCLTNCSGANQFCALAGTCILGGGPAHNQGCFCTPLSFSLNACGIALLNADILAGQPFILGGSDPCACTTTNVADIFSGTRPQQLVGLDITFAPQAGGAPELGSRTAVFPLALGVGLLCVVESRRKRSQDRVASIA